MIPLTHEGFYLERRKELAEQLHTALRGLEPRDDFMEAMRLFKTAKQRDLKEAYAHEQISLEQMMLALTGLAELCLEASAHYEQEAMQEKYGRAEGDLSIVGMGKFGAYEMTLHSDLDLIFLYSDKEESDSLRGLNSQEYYVRLVQRMISNLSIMTRHGFAYRVDTNLRPSGRAGILVSTRKSFVEYHAKEARLWEKQALLRARLISPNADARQHMDQALSAQIWNRDYTPEIAVEIHDLRCRMERELAKEGGDRYNLKVGLGGIVDIEFIVQYLQLVHGRTHPQVLTPHTMTALRLLAAEKIMPDETANRTMEAYLFYRAVETEMREIRESATECFPSLGENGELIAKRLKHESYNVMLKRFLVYREQTRQQYRTILGLL